MRPTTEPKYTWLLLQGKTPSQAAFTLLTNGTQLNTREKEELENMLCTDLYLAIKYKLDYRKGPWPKLDERLKVKETEAAFTLPANSPATDVLDAMLFMQAYVEAKG